MKRLLLVPVFFLVLAGELLAQNAPDGPKLTKLLQDFLAGAGKNDAAMHQRFWADDLIYTSSAGKRMGKADILRDVEKDGPTKPDADEQVVYTAEDLRIQEYGSMAVLAFRLVATESKGGKSEVAQYLNSGTFLKRDGQWQVVNWQATKIPEKPQP